MHATDAEENMVNEIDQLCDYLTFTLGAEEYAINILTVQEIRAYGAVTSIANMPDFIKGVSNLRGVILPIVDMRIKFNSGDVTYNETTIVIVLNIANRLVGMVVDSVTDVISIGETDIKPPPEFGTLLDTQYIKGLGVIDERMLILINIEHLMTSEEMALVDTLAK